MPCRWLGVDQIFLKENAAAVPGALQKRLAPLISEGFLVLGSLPGPKHPLQNRWYNRCSKPDMAGKHSWVTFIDLDEYMVVLDKCAPTPLAVDAAFDLSLRCAESRNVQNFSAMLHIWNAVRSVRCDLPVRLRGQQQH